MNDATKTPPYSCHESSPSGEEVEHYASDKNHCTEIYVPRSEYSDFWKAVGNWKFPKASSGKCRAPFTTIDSTTHDKQYPHVTYVKRGIALPSQLVQPELAAPSGTYHGETKALGVDVKATITIDDSSHADISIVASGIVSVDVNCKKEQYSIDASGKVTLPGQSTSGDCVHDSLQKYTVDLKGISYDSGADSIELDVHKIINLKIKLTKGSLQINLGEPDQSCKTDA